MPITLTAPFTWPNGTRLVIDKVSPNDEDAVLTVVIQLRTPPASNHVGTEKVLKVRNGACDRLSRNASPGDLMRWDGWLIHEPGALTLASGYDNAMNAWRSGANAQARRAALEAHLLAVGVIHSSLAGT